jgi:hypothetical protein
LIGSHAYHGTSMAHGLGPGPTSLLLQQLLINSIAFAVAHIPHAANGNEVPEFDLDASASGVSAPARLAALRNLSRELTFAAQLGPLQATEPRSDVVALVTGDQLAVTGRVRICNTHIDPDCERLPPRAPRGRLQPAHGKAGTLQPGSGGLSQDRQQCIRLLATPSAPAREGILAGALLVRPLSSPR